ncbi:MAG: DUF418 domain-containing protein [Thermoanaerobaculia bacterium]
MKKSGGSRLLGLDVARALAIFGMVVVNFKIVMVASNSGSALMSMLPRLFEGRASATFVILAGVGLALLSRRARESADPAAIQKARMRILKRALFLFVVGLLYYPIYVGDILHFYGVYLALVAFVFTARDRHLWWIAGLAALGFVVLILTLDYEASWNWETLEYADPWTPRGLVRRIFFNGLHPVVPWFSFVAFGLWLGRRPMSDRGWRRRALAVSVPLAIGTELLSKAAIRLASPEGPSEVATALLATAPMPPMPQYLLAAGATGVAVIVLCVELTERCRAHVLCRALVAAGQLSLTLYVAHVLVGMTTLDALGRLENQSPAFSLACSVLFWLLGIGFALVWRRRFHRGPLEGLMRRVTG